MIAPHNGLSCWAENKIYKLAHSSPRLAATDQIERLDEGIAAIAQSAKGGQTPSTGTTRTRKAGSGVAVIVPVMFPVILPGIPSVIIPVALCEGVGVAVATLPDWDMTNARET